MHEYPKTWWNQLNWTSQLSWWTQLNNRIWWTQLNWTSQLSWWTQLNITWWTQLRASSVGRPVLPATVYAGSPGFGPTPSLPVPLLRGSRQKSSRSRHFFQFWREHDPPDTVESNAIKGHRSCSIEDVESKANHKNRGEEDHRKLSYKMLGAGGTCRAQGWTPLPPLLPSHSQVSLQTGLPGASTGNGLRMPLIEHLSYLNDSLLSVHERLILSIHFFSRNLVPKSDLITLHVTRLSLKKVGPDWELNAHELDIRYLGQAQAVYKVGLNKLKLGWFAITCIFLAPSSPARHLFPESSNLSPKALDCNLKWPPLIHSITLANPMLQTKAPIHQTTSSDDQKHF